MYSWHFMLRPIRKVKNLKNRFSVNSQNLLYTIFCESTVCISFVLGRTVNTYIIHYCHISLFLKLGRGAARQYISILLSLFSQTKSKFNTNINETSLHELVQDGCFHWDISGLLLTHLCKTYLREYYKRTGLGKVLFDTGDMYNLILNLKHFDGVFALLSYRW